MRKILLTIYIFSTILIADNFKKDIKFENRINKIIEILPTTYKKDKDVIARIYKISIDKNLVTYNLEEILDKIINKSKFNKLQKLIKSNDKYITLMLSAYKASTLPQLCSIETKTLKKGYIFLYNIRYVFKNNKKINIGYFKITYEDCKL